MIILVKRISSSGKRTTSFKEFNTLTEAKTYVYKQLSKVSKDLEVVKVTILDEDLNSIFHEINGESPFDMKTS